jgi:hypothetical protein
MDGYSDVDTNTGINQYSLVGYRIQAQRGQHQGQTNNVYIVYIYILVIYIYIYVIYVYIFVINIYILVIYVYILVIYIYILVIYIYTSIH